MADKSWELVTIEDAQGMRLSNSKTALMVEVEGEIHWVPVSLIDDDSECYAPHTDGTLIIPEWLAIEKGLV